MGVWRAVLVAPGGGGAAPVPHGHSAAPLPLPAAAPAPGPRPGPTAAGKRAVCVKSVITATNDTLVYSLLYTLATVYIYMIVDRLLVLKGIWPRLAIDTGPPK